jgi:glycosyltransferase involved in cell wall biosynthesis
MESGREIPPRGGTQLLLENLFARLDPALLKGINLIVSSTRPELFDPKKFNIVWAHHNVDQPPMRFLSDPSLVGQIDLIIFVSHWQYQKYRDNFDLPDHKVMVIPNAVEPIARNTQKPRKLKLIHTSTPWRGLEVLLDAFEMADISDIELDVFSSTIIYGSDFDREMLKHYEHLFEKASQMPNVNYCGYAPNEQIREALEQAHIFAYPSIWEETSCLGAIEAGMAGLNLLVTNYGALPETCGPWANYVQSDSNVASLKLKYAAALENIAGAYWSDENQRQLARQSDYFNLHYSWDRRIQEWEYLFGELQKMLR